MVAGAVLAAGQELTGLGDDLPELIAGSAEQGVLALRFQPGELVQDTVAESDPAVFHAAGRILARVHDSAPAVRSIDYPTQRLDRLRRMLPRLNDPELSAAVSRLHVEAEPLVRTHGDVAARNWLIDAGRVRVIDFGCYALRPGYSDLVRVWHRYPPGDQRTAALIDGLGLGAPRGPGWFAENLYQGAATVIWATDNGLADFAVEGRRMLRRTLDDGTMDR